MEFMCTHFIAQDNGEVVPVISCREEREREKEEITTRVLDTHPFFIVKNVHDH